MKVETELMCIVVSLAVVQLVHLFSLKFKSLCLFFVNFHTIKAFNKNCIILE